MGRAYPIKKPILLKKAGLTWGNPYTSCSQVLPREQQSSWQRPPWFPRRVRSGCGHPLCSWEPMWLNTIMFVDINVVVVVILETEMALNRIHELIVSYLI